MRKRNLIAFLVCFVIVYICLGVWLVAECALKSDFGVTGVAILSALTGLIALPLTVYSSFVVYEGIRHGRICTKAMAKKGAKKIAGLIKIFSPTVIIFVEGNSEDLYNNYIADNLRSSYHTLALPACIRYKQKPFMADTTLLTNKFYIDASLLDLVQPSDRVIIFDDVTKTGETIEAIKSYLTSSRKLARENIVTCGFIVDKCGYGKNSEPVLYFKRTEVRDDYAFPWRKK